MSPGAGPGVFVTEGPQGSGVIDIRDAATGDRVRSWPGHDGDVIDVAFSPDGSKLAATLSRGIGPGYTGWLKVWDASTGNLLASLAGPEDAFGPSFSADGSMVAAVWDTNTVRAVDLSTGQTVVWDTGIGNT